MKLEVKGQNQTILKCNLTCEMPVHLLPLVWILWIYLSIRQEYDIWLISNFFSFREYKGKPPCISPRWSAPDLRDQLSMFLVKTQMHWYGTNWWATLAEVYLFFHEWHHVTFFTEVNNPIKCTLLTKYERINLKHLLASDILHCRRNLSFVCSQWRSFAILWAHLHWWVLMWGIWSIFTLRNILDMQTPSHKPCQEFVLTNLNP